MSSVALRRPLEPGILRPSPEAPRLTRPLFGCTVPAGFPSPADDYVVDQLDLNELLIVHREATFFMRARGVSMVGAGIQDGDLLVVDRSLTVRHRSIVIAVVDGDITCKRYYRRAGRVRLTAEHPDYPPIEFADGQELLVWGVVKNIIRDVL